MKSLIRKGMSCLLLALATVAGYAQGAAEKGALVLRIAKPDGCSAQVAYPSSNGDWVTGGVYDGSTYQAYRWNTRTNEFEYLNAYGEFSFGYSVSNDGVVAGEFTTSELLPNGAGIQAPCVWYDGKWHVLNLGKTGGIDPELPSAGGARKITPDGKYVAGAVCTSAGWKACVWQLDAAQSHSTLTVLPMEELGVAEHLSDDAQVVGGFDEARSVRIPAYWTRQGGKYTEVIPDGRKHQGMWTITCGVSPNGRYVATWNMLHDLQEGTSVQVDKNTNVDAATVAGVTSQGIVFGAGQRLTDEGIDQFAAYFRNGQWVSLQKELEEKGAVIGGYKLTELRYMSDDGKVLCCNARYPDGMTGAVMIRLDENVTSRPPVALKAMQMGGLKAVRLNWKEPLANAEGVKEYVLLRDGQEIYRGNALQYTDRSCELGKTYTYTVRASYGSVVSEDSDPAVLETKAVNIGGPSMLMARQAGIDNVRLEWEGAGSSLSELKYYTDGREVSGFGGGAWSIEAGVRFRSEDLGLFENMEISEVSFWPMSPQKEWKVNFYLASATDGEPFYSETLDATKLVYGSCNNIRLQKAVQVPQGEDLVVGVYAAVKGSSFNVLGLMLGDNEAGYNDLIRQPGEKFVSLYQDGLENGYEYPYCWPIGLGLSTIGGDMASLSGYRVYQDGKVVDKVDAAVLKSVLHEVADGDHEYAVTAVYTNDKESDAAKASLSVKRDTRFYQVDDISVKPTGKALEAVVEWKAPKDDERTMLTYSQGSVHHGVHTSANEGFSFQAASVYTQPMFKQYLSDYQISGVCFYPLGHAEFALYLNESGKTRWSTELEREVDYDLNRWNTVWLDEPVALDASVSELQLIVDCFDGDAGRDILAMDNMPANANYSDLYSLDDGASWDSYESQTGTRGNWMMGLVITSRDQKALPVKEYVLTWDGSADGRTTVPAGDALSVKHTFGQTQASHHQVVITAVYENNEAWESQPCTINWMLDATPIVAPEAHVGVTDVFDLQGRKVASPTRGIYVKDGKKVIR